MSNIKKKQHCDKNPPTISFAIRQNIRLICRCFSKVIKTVNIRFMLACVPLCSNWKRLDNRERRFRRTENGLPYIVLRSSLQICEEIQKRIA